ncbi:MAG: branched-chain amino acid aminotransferase [Cyclobacteriaceae bacterium]
MMQNKIKITKTSSSRLKDVDFKNLGFGRVFSDHMFVAEYKNGKWQEGEIVPFGNISVSPSLATLHYSQTIFEGLKAFKYPNGEAKVYRPDQHAARLNLSAERICIPSFPEDIFVDAVKTLINLDKGWIPSEKGDSLYVRPFMFATDEFLGVRPSEEYKFIILTSPAGSYYDGNVKVLVEDTYVRATEGGTGATKTGGNYAASLLPAKQALEKGYDQILWTDAKEHKYVEEIGTMNVMFQIGDTIVTPELNSSLLGGITRKSIIELCKHWNIPIEERKISIDELIEASKKGLLKDAFGTGTAATITHIDSLTYKGTEITLPSKEERSISNKLQAYLTGMKFGEVEDELGWMVSIDQTAHTV